MQDTNYSEDHIIKVLFSTLNFEQFVKPKTFVQLEMKMIKLN
jgi:hypothetical protein